MLCAFAGLIINISWIKMEGINNLKTISKWSEQIRTKRRQHSPLPHKVPTLTYTVMMAR
jgi:hypothetical protein